MFDSKVLNFGSCTWPVFMAKLARFNAVTWCFATLANFSIIYIQEALKELWCQGSSRSQKEDSPTNARYPHWQWNTKKGHKKEKSQDPRYLYKQWDAQEERVLPTRLPEPIRYQRHGVGKEPAVPAPPSNHLGNEENNSDLGSAWRCRLHPNHSTFASNAEVQVNTMEKWETQDGDDDCGFCVKQDETEQHWDASFEVKADHLCL